jgi:hypothetical protein
MSDRDNITLPRELVQEALEALERYATDEAPEGWHAIAAITALRAHLAAPRPEPEKERAEVAAPARSGVAQTEEIDSFTPEAYHEKRHPGYIIGNHRLETAYVRLCAGESEDAILEDYELAREPRLRDLRRDAERYRRLLKWLIVTGLLTRERCRIDSPASYGDWWILRKPKVIEAGFVGYGKTEDAAIDAAMEPATEPAMPCAYPHCCDKAGSRCPRMFAGQCSGPRAADPQQVGR